MILNSLPRKITLAILLAFGSVVWLNAWHQYVYTRSRVDFPPVSNSLRDTLVILIPVMLAVWIGNSFTHWFIERANRRISPSTQSILSAAILAGLASLAILLMEDSRIFRTGIGNEFVFLASICNKVYSNGNLLLSILRWMVPGTRALRLHILFQDGFNLMLFNLATTLFLVMVMEGYVSVKARNAYAREKG